MMYSSLEATGSIMNKKMSGHVQPAQELESTKIIDIKLKEKRKRSDEDSGPITWDGDMPQKRFYRQRAHCNPLSFNDSFEHKANPEDVCWEELYPKFKGVPIVRYLDVGCGFGGFLVTMSQLCPDSCILGMEIRTKVAEYVRLRVESLRQKKEGDASNVAVIRTNSMLYLLNYIWRGQLDALFFAFPDPHFKAKNFKRRIISSSLLSEYAYVLKEGGLLYCTTDVPALHSWHVEKLDGHPAFARVPDEEVTNDPKLKAMMNDTEEGKKVARADGLKHFAVYRRLPNHDVIVTPLP